MSIDLISFYISFTGFYSIPMRVLTTEPDIQFFSFELGYGHRRLDTSPSNFTMVYYKLNNLIGLLKAFLNITVYMNNLPPQVIVRIHFWEQYLSIRLQCLLWV